MSNADRIREMLKEQRQAGEQPSAIQMALMSEIDRLAGLDYNGQWLDGYGSGIAREKDRMRAFVHDAMTKHMSTYDDVGKVWAAVLKAIDD